MKSRQIFIFSTILYLAASVMFLCCVFLNRTGLLLAGAGTLSAASLLKLQGTRIAKREKSENGQ